jgi:hypothetical protein
MVVPNNITLQSKSTDQITTNPTCCIRRVNFTIHSCSSIPTMDSGILIMVVDLGGVDLGVVVDVVVAGLVIDVDHSTTASSLFVLSWHHLDAMKVVEAMKLVEAMVAVEVVIAVVVEAYGLMTYNVPSQGKVQ